MDKSKLTPGAYKYRLPCWPPNEWAHVWVGSRPDVSDEMVVQVKPDYYPIALSEIQDNAIFEPED